MNARVQQILDSLEAQETPFLKADGLDDAIIGSGSYGILISDSILIYDVNKVIDILMTRDGMSYEDAVEFFEFNILDAWVGDGTPMFIYTE